MNSPTYVPDKPCQSGHRLRWVKSGHCVECRIQYSKSDIGKEVGTRYYVNNFDKISNRSKMYHKTESFRKSIRKSYRKQAHLQIANQANVNINDWAGYLLKSAKTRAKNRGIDISIDRDFLEDQLARQGGRCYFSGIPLSLGGKLGNLDRPSLDRIDPLGPYSAGNTVISCSFVNMGRRRATPEETNRILGAMQMVLNG